MKIKHNKKEYEYRLLILEDYIQVTAFLNKYLLQLQLLHFHVYKCYILQ